MKYNDIDVMSLTTIGNIETHLLINIYLLDAKKQKMVPSDLLEKQTLELEIKNEAIEMLGQKITHLQNLIQLKDKRIEELNQKLEECLSKEAQSQSSFFKIF